MAYEEMQKFLLASRSKRVPDQDSDGAAPKLVRFSTIELDVAILSVIALHSDLVVTKFLLYSGVRVAWSNIMANPCPVC